VSVAPAPPLAIQDGGLLNDFLAFYLVGLAILVACMTILWIISAPLLGGQIQGGALKAVDYLGLIIWIVGFIFEAGSDLKLARFKADPANSGKPLTSGF
jgi:steroid 5-alpha reductase family enzyme